MHGSAIILALVAVMIVGSLATYTVSRVVSNERQAGEKQINDKADAAAEAGLAVALAELQRGGSANAGNVERSQSVFDACNINGTTTAEICYVNGEDDQDGRYQYRVRSRSAGYCAGPRKRLLMVIGRYQNQRRSRYLCLDVVPRILRYGLFADGVNNADDAVLVRDGFRLLMPPTYRTTYDDDPTSGINQEEWDEALNGADLGANKRISFLANGSANWRPGSISLYDKLFLPPLPGGMTGDNTRFTQRYQPTGSGAPDLSDIARWGTAHTAPRNPGSRTPWGVRSGSTDGTATTITRFPSPASLQTFNGVNFEGKPVTLANRTELPDFTQVLGQWRGGASDVWGPDPDNNDPTDLQALISAVSNPASVQRLNGVHYVDCRSENRTITISGELRVSGSLILDGCNLQIASTGKLNIQRDMSRYTAPVAGRTCTPTTDGQIYRPYTSPADRDDDGEPDFEMLRECIWNYPGLALIRDRTDVGGDFSSQATSSNAVNVQGVTLVQGDMRVASTTGGSDQANLNFVGATLVEGRFCATGASAPTCDPSAPAASGTGNAVFRWHPLAQRIFFDPGDGRMGTYTMRTDDRELPRTTPRVSLISPFPASPTSDNQATFTWSTNGIYDSVVCTLTNDDNQLVAEELCDGGTYTTPVLARFKTYTFTVQACVYGLRKNIATTMCSPIKLDTPNKTRHVWEVGAPAAEVKILDNSKPTNPTFERKYDFRFELRNEPTSIQCRLNEENWRACNGAPLTDSGPKRTKFKLTPPSGSGTGASWADQICPSWQCPSGLVDDSRQDSSSSLTGIRDQISRSMLDSAAGWLPQCAGNNPPTNTTTQCMVYEQVNRDASSQILSGEVSFYNFSDDNLNSNLVNLARSSCGGLCLDSGYPFGRYVRDLIRAQQVATPQANSNGLPAGDSRTKIAYRTHTFQVRACNPMGCGTDEYSWTGNQPPAPTVTIDNPRPSSPSIHTATTATLNFTVNGLAIEEVECSLNGSAWEACTSPKTYTSLAKDTTHNFKVRACNGTCTEAAYSWYINPAPPRVRFTSPNDPEDDGYVNGGNRAWNATSQNPTWTTTSRIDGLQCSLDGGAWFSCVSGQTISAGACANHTLQVRATNVSGSYTSRYDWHQNCSPITGLRFTQVPGPFHWDQTDYQWTWDNPGGGTAGYGGCEILATWWGWQNCHDWWRTTLGVKPPGDHWVVVRVWNADRTAYSEISHLWTRWYNQIWNGYFDDGSYWNNWGSCTIGGSGDYLVGAEHVGGPHSGHSGMALKTVNHPGNWACAYTGNFFGRGDDIRFAAVSDWFGNVLGYGTARLEVWTGSGWAAHQSIEWPGFHSDFNWRWLRLRGDSYYGWTNRIVIYGASRLNGCAPTNWGCGTRFDSFDGTWSNWGVNGVTNG